MCGPTAAATLSRWVTPRAACRQFSNSAQLGKGDADNKPSRHNGSGLDAAALLEQPSWSVASLLSVRHTKMPGDSEITLDKLRRLLQLSALPFPACPKEQAAKLKALRTQLHFVRDIQQFDTTGILPLQAIRDESHSAVKAQTIGMKEVEQALLQEESFGHNRRPRRRKDWASASDGEVWDVMKTASQRAGRYIVVNDTKQ